MLQRVTYSPTGRLLLFLCGAAISAGFPGCNKENPVDVPAEVYYQLTVVADTGGNVITPVQSPMNIRKGSVATISARPQRGYLFARWAVAGENATLTYMNIADAVVTLNGDDTVRAEFIAVPSLPDHIDISGVPTENGANFARYAGSWTRLPDFAALSFDTAGPVDSLSVAAITHTGQGFGAILSGYLSIPIDGNYTFYLTSSDGSSLYLNDSLVLLNDGVHAEPVQDSVVVQLTQGVYLITVHYFNRVSSPFLNVSYACTDNGIDKITIPTDALKRCDTRPAVKIIVNNPVGGETYCLGDTIHLHWTYKNPRGQVYAQLSVNNGRSYKNISANAFPGNATSYDWVIPMNADSLITQTALIRVEEYPPFTVKGVSRPFAIARR